VRDRLPPAGLRDARSPHWAGIGRSLKTQQLGAPPSEEVGTTIGVDVFQASRSTGRQLLHITASGAYGAREATVFPRKEVIQPQLPLRLPCYDFTPITDSTFGRCLPCGLAHGLRVFPAFVV
jgi:hypothetical protein